MKPRRMSHDSNPVSCVQLAIFVMAGVAAVSVAAGAPPGETTRRITVTIDRGRDIGQSFGSLFEVTSSDGAVVIGAGFPNLYNTRYRADRHSLQFFVRPTSGQRSHESEKLPRPNELCGTYLYGREEVVRSTYGGVKVWNPQTQSWEREDGPAPCQP